MEPQGTPRSQSLQWNCFHETNAAVASLLFMGSLGSTRAHPPHPAYSCGLRLAAGVAVHIMNGFEQDVCPLARTAIQSLASGVEYIQGRYDPTRAERALCESSCPTSYHRTPSTPRGSSPGETIRSIDYLLRSLLLHHGKCFSHGRRRHLCRCCHLNFWQRIMERGL